MAPRKQPWFRLYVEAVTDMKLARLTPAQKWLWVVVLAAAKQSAIEGFLMLSEREPMTAVDLARMADMRERDVTEGLELMSRLGLIDVDRNLGAFQVVAWSRRQYESDNGTARTRKHRSKVVRWNDDGTFHQRSGNGDGTHQITDTETETETTPPSPPPTLAAVPDPNGGRKRPQRGSQLPDGWKPNDRHEAYATEQSLDLNHEMSQFASHHKAKGSVMKDWDQAFWTWLRNAKKWARPAPASADSPDYYRSLL